MVNTNKLKGRVVEMGKTYKEVAKATGIGYSTLRQKIRNDRTFDVLEAKKVAEILDIKREEVADYFFC